MIPREKYHHRDGGGNERQEAERRTGCLADRNREREINALSNVFKKTNQNHGNKTIKLHDNVIV